MLVMNEDLGRKARGTSLPVANKKQPSSHIADSVIDGEFTGGPRPANTLLTAPSTNTNRIQVARVHRETPS